MHLSPWRHAILGVVAMLFAGIIYAWSVLSLPIAKEFTSWTKGQLSLTFTIVMITFCVAQIIRGSLAKFLSAKATIRIGAVLLLAGFFLSARTHSLLGLYMGFGVLCGFGSGFVYNTVMGTVVHRFPDHPGLISGILLMGFGVSSFLAGKLYQVCTPPHVGAWRNSFLLMGVLTFVIVSICSLFFDVAPAEIKLSVHSSTETPVGKSLAPHQMLRSAFFWLYFLWGVLTTATGLVLISQGSDIVISVTPSIASGNLTTIVGLLSICNAFGRVLFGGMYDKLGRRVTMEVVNALFMLTAILLLLALLRHRVIYIVCAYITGGLAYSGGSPTNSAYCRAYFGPQYYAVNLPVINSIMIAASFASTASGALFDHSGSYYSTSCLIIALTIAAFLFSGTITMLDQRNYKK